MADWDFDLLGDPIPPGRGKRGRPQHVPTDKIRREIIALMAFGKSDEQIAARYSISIPTLKKYYFRQLRQRSEARERLDGKLIGALLKGVDEGNVSAIDKLWKRLDKHDLALLADRAANRGSEQREAVVPKGKKEAAKEAAAKVGGKFAPPSAPRLIN